MTILSLLFDSILPVACVIYVAVFGHDITLTRFEAVEALAILFVLVQTREHCESRARMLGQHLDRLESVCRSFIRAVNALRGPQSLAMAAGALGAMAKGSAAVLHAHTIERRLKSLPMLLRLFFRWRVLVWGRRYLFGRQDANTRCRLLKWSNKLFGVEITASVFNRGRFVGDRWVGEPSDMADAVIELVSMAKAVTS